MDSRSENSNIDNSPKNNGPKNKFLFDLNNFDKSQEEEIDVVEEEIEVEPPPPTFSEDELEAAKAIAHSRGASQGHAEEKEHRENHIAQSLNTISEKFSSVFADETYREKQYEEEALRLGLEIIDLLAPSLSTRLGEEALKAALSDVLKRQSQQSEIRIEVDPESTSEIDKYIENIWADKDHAPRYKVVANSELDKGACHINWKDGGMVRNPQKTAQAIKEAIEALLVEQVISKTTPPLTIEENNAIKGSEGSDSLDLSELEESNGEKKND